MKRKPGPKPKAGGKVDALSALERELARLKAENAELRRRSQQGPKSKDEIKPAGSRTERLNHPRDELDIANAKIASMRWEIRELQAKLKVKVEMPKDIVALQQQLMAAETELRNLKVGMKAIRRTLDEARRANPVTITMAQFALLQKVFHPDPEHDTATPERKQQLLDAAQVFNAIKFNVPGRKEKPKPSK
jgi:predicted  nucleic acid-binding Zn-ribbon protein